MVLVCAAPPGAKLMKRILRPMALFNECIVMHGREMSKHAQSRTRSSLAARIDRPATYGKI